MIKKTNKTATTDVILVATGDKVLPTGALVTTSTAFNLLDGQVGVLSYDSNSTVRPLGNFLVSGDDSSEVAAIKLVQGTPKSNQTQTVSLWEDGDKAKVESCIIRKNHILSVAVKKADFGQWGATSVSGFTTPQDDLVYGAYFNLDSPRIDREYRMNDKTQYASSKSQDYSVVGIAQPLDYVLQDIAYQFNAQSRLVYHSGQTLRGTREQVVLGVKIAGGAGQALGTITPSTVVNFELRNGVNQTIVFGRDGVAALADLMQKDANLVATSTIEVLDFKTAGTTAKVDALIFLGLPAIPSPAFDDIHQLQTAVDIQLSPTFGTYLKTDVSAKESVNSGRSWLINWRNRPGTMVHTMQMLPQGDYFLEGKHYINDAKSYTSYAIEFVDVDPTIYGGHTGQKRATMLLPCEVLSSFVANVTNVAARLAANNSAYPMVTSNDAGTGTASANTVAGLEGVLTAWLEHARTTGTGFTVTGDAIAGGVYLS